MDESFSAQSREAVAAELRRRLAEPPPTRVQVLTGPRQVGKTTLLVQLADELPGAVYRAVDAPEAALPGWWDSVWRDVQERGKQGPVVVLLDEIQYLDRWERLVKAKADELRRKKSPIHMVLSGSSALLVGRGLKETMAGRFERLVMSHWSAGDLRDAFGLGDDEAVEYAVRRGGYPGTLALRDEPTRWQAYVRDSIIEPAIGRDIMMLEAVRKPALLRQLFWVCLGHPAEIVSVQKLVGQLSGAGSIETVAHYLELLGQAFLIVGVEKYSARMIRRRSAPPKIVVLNNALMAALGDVAEDPSRWGAWVENACLAHAWNRGQQVFYWREEPYEVDAVLSGSWGKWAIEVKTGDFSPSDIGGLMEFCRRNPGFRPLVLCSPAYIRDDIPGVRFMSWRRFLLGQEG